MLANVRTEERLNNQSHPVSIRYPQQPLFWLEDRRTVSTTDAGPNLIAYLEFDVGLGDAIASGIPVGNDLSLERLELPDI